MKVRAWLQSKGYIGVAILEQQLTQFKAQGVIKDFSILGPVVEQLPTGRIEVWLPSDNDALMAKVAGLRF